MNLLRYHVRILQIGGVSIPTSNGGCPPVLYGEKYAHNRKPVLKKKNHKPGR